MLAEILPQHYTINCLVLRCSAITMTPPFATHSYIIDEHVSFGIGCNVIPSPKVCIKYNIMIVKSRLCGMPGKYTDALMQSVSFSTIMFPHTSHRGAA